jgi:maltose O-acetyltransferase
MHVYDILAGARRRALRTMQRHRFASFGPGSTYDPTTSSFDGYEHIHIGRNVFIGRHAIVFVVDADLVIGDDTIIGPGLCVMSGNHVFDLPGRSFREITEGRNLPIVIGRNVWIGARVIILSGVQIGDGAVIGAGAVVTKDIPPFAVAVGNPARVLRWRFEGVEREKHEAFIERELSMPEVRAQSVGREEAQPSEAVR